ncbi:MAG: ABC transporter substrate-binding protein [Lentisphaeria bacterium]|nr:ABC transporter substrate-binding protein [Lentisphaeria bacterium]
MKMVKWRLALLFFPLCACLADGEKETREILEKTIDKGVAILKDTSLDNDTRINAFDTLLNESCHLDLMAMLSLGKTHWMAFTPEQREEFIKSYTRLIVRSYYEKIKQVDTTDIAVTYTKNEAVSKTKRELEATMRAGETILNVVYKFTMRNTGWGVYDVEIEGVSLIVSYRSQFNDFLATRPPEELLSELAKDDNGFKPAKQSPEPLE